ncbi:MAG: alpha/beta hydrolase [Ilumatobacteraceae bacterium]
MTVTAREGWTDRSGPRIRFLDNAPAEPVGLPLLLSPGFTDHADEYLAVLEFFVPRRAVVVEVRGRGGSEAPDDGYSAAAHAEDLRAVVDEAGFDRFHLMTFSRGTTWGLDLALGDPDRVATVSIGDYPPGEIALDEQRADDIMTSRFRGRPMPDRIPSHVPAAVFRSSHDRDLTDVLAATAIPVLIATGTEAGCLLDVAALAEYETRIPGSETVVIAGAAHDLFRPDRLAYPRAVADFITRRAPGR